jgi:hypothetical protein
VLLVGLVDLLLAHPGLVIGRETLARLLVEAKDLDLYRYMATALLASGHDALRQLVLDASRGMLESAKDVVLLEVLGEASDAEDVRAALVALQARRGSRARR